MRIGLFSAVAFGLAAAIVGCGGKVVVDNGTAVGGGGSGTGTGTTISTTSGGGTCGTVSCGEGSDGSCACSGVCNAQALEVQCVPIQGGASCTCIENDIKIAVCVQEGAFACGILDECCAAQFFGQAGQ